MTDKQPGIRKGCVTTGKLTVCFGVGLVLNRETLALVGTAPEPPVKPRKKKGQSRG